MAARNAKLTDAHVAAWKRLLHASHRVVQRIESELKAAGLPNLVWYDLLLELKQAEPEGLRPYQLQTSMLMPQHNMSRLIDRLEKAGYAKRFACDDDGRGQIVRITEQGRSLQRKMWPIYRGVLTQELAVQLSLDEAHNLSALLGALADTS